MVVIESKERKSKQLVNLKKIQDIFRNKSVHKQNRGTLKDTLSGSSLVCDFGQFIARCAQMENHVGHYLAWMDGRAKDYENVYSSDIQFKERIEEIRTRETDPDILEILCYVDQIRILRNQLVHSHTIIDANTILEFRYNNKNGKPYHILITKDDFDYLNEAVMKMNSILYSVTLDKSFEMTHETAREAI